MGIAGGGGGLIAQRLSGWRKIRASGPDGRERPPSHVGRDRADLASACERNHADLCEVGESLATAIKRDSIAD
jgi:hypothetical protein